jgi:arabinogalactan oligomer/maltooligosaccharide transport system substrate-binding protein
VKNSLVTLLLLFSALFIFSGCSKLLEKKPVTLSLWTNERDSENGLQWIKDIARDFYSENGYIKIEILNKETQSLWEDFHTAALAGVSPDLLWTSSGLINPFIESGLIQPVDAFTDTTKFFEPVIMKNHTWTVPVSTGNHLMLMVNKNHLSRLPVNTDDFIKAAKANTKDGIYGLAYNFYDGFWIIPWLGGFGGSLFDTDGVTPALDSAAMINTLTFLKDLRFKHKVTPSQTDYNTADTLFKTGKAAMIINGDWSISHYKQALGENLMIGRLPKISASGKWPSPFISGSYLMIPANLPKEKKIAVKEFIAYVTSAGLQAEQLKELSKLPGLKESFSNKTIMTDPLLIGSVAQIEVGTPAPLSLEMIAIINAVNSQLEALMTGAVTPAGAAKKMQEAALREIADQR